MHASRTSPAGAQRCQMLREAGDLGDVAAPVRGDVAADICIVGGGYLGLWTAIGLLEAEPSARVAVVEADICGGGASGRNSGMALAYWSKVQALVAACGAEEALRLCAASAQAIGDTAAFAERHGLDIEFARTGWLWGATCAAQEGRWAPVVDLLENLGVAPFRTLGRADVSALVDADGYLCGVFDESAATLHPGKLARGLRRVAASMGAMIFENSPMTALRRGRPTAVTCPEGRVTADRIVLAMNVWSLAVPELRSGILVITSDDAITAPARDFLERHNWVDGPILTDSGTFVSGYRPTRDGRIVAGVTGGTIGFGALRGQRFEGRTPRESAIARALQAAFRDASEVTIAASWRGPIDRTRSGLPIFGSLPGSPRILFGYGFSGNGIVGCRVGAQVLTALALEQRDAWAATPLVRRPERWMPPEPARYLGAHLVRWAVRRQDRLDREGRRQGLIGRRLAALAPGGIVTTRTA